MIGILSLLSPTRCITAWVPEAGVAPASWTLMVSELKTVNSDEPQLTESDPEDVLAVLLTTNEVTEPNEALTTGVAQAAFADELPHTTDRAIKARITIFLYILFMPRQADKAADEETSSRKPATTAV